MSQSDSSPTKEPKLDDDGLGNGKSHNEIDAGGIREEKDNEVENDMNKSPHYDPFENVSGAPSFSYPPPPYLYSTSPYYSPYHIPTTPNNSHTSPKDYPYCPYYNPLTPNYFHTSPNTSHTSPKDYPYCPYYIPLTPNYFHTSPNYSHTSPSYSPISPAYSPCSLPKNYVDMEAPNKTSDHLKEIGDQSNHVIGGNNNHEVEATRMIHVPCSKVALLVGAAATLRFLRHNLCARIRILNDSEADLKSVLRPVELTGTVLQIEFAQQLIDSVLAEENHDEPMEEETKKPSSHIEQVHAGSEHPTCDAATSPRT